MVNVNKKALTNSCFVINIEFMFGNSILTRG